MLTVTSEIDFQRVTRGRVDGGLLQGDEGDLSRVGGFPPRGGLPGVINQNFDVRDCNTYLKKTVAFSFLELIVIV